MKHYNSKLICFIGLLILMFIQTSCSDSEKESVAESKKLNQIFDEYFEETLKLYPTYATYIGDNRYDDRLQNDASITLRNADKNLSIKYLKKISAINRNLLQGQDKISYDIFESDMQLNIEYYQYSFYLIPIDQMNSWASYFAVLGSGSDIQPFKIVKDYYNFLSRVNDFQALIDTTIDNMKEGIKTGVVQPKILMAKCLPQIKEHVVKNVNQSIFYRPISNMPSNFSKEDKKNLTSAYTKMIQNQIIPTYSKLYNFIKDEYIPHCRESIAFSDLPNGKQWYAYLIKRQTTTNMSPDEIYQIGLEEVARIKKEMEKVKEQVGYKGDLKSFFNFLRTNPKFYYTKSEDLLAGYEQIKKKVDPQLSKLFGIIPKTNYEIKPVEEFMAKTEPAARYMGPSEDGKRAGIFYVNTYDLKSRPKYDMESLSLHEASPGHHFQISIQQGQKGLPKFRRFEFYNSYVEGWALYSEGLGKDLGLYTDPYQYFGNLSDEIFRAIRLVVDVGIHTKGWSREKAINYLLDNCALTKTDAVAEIERYIAWPGQALAYKIGQLKISELRSRAEKELGSKFKIRNFHDEILNDGALPLDVLDSKIQEWINSEKLASNN